MGIKLPLVLVHNHPIMKKFFLLTILLVLAHAALPQNVGIGETNPTVKLTVKGSSILPSFLVKNGDDDSLLFASYRSLYLGGYHLTANGVVNISNKIYLPFDPPTVNLIAAGERSGVNANGSGASLRFSNGNTNKYYEINSYTGGESENHYWSLAHRDPDRVDQFQYLVHIKATGETGFGTYSPLGRLQINHRASMGSPTLNLVDSTFGNLPVIRLANLSSPDFWQIRGSITTSNPANTFLEFGTQAAARMVLRGDGNLGLGIATPGEKLDVAGNARITGELNRVSTGGANLVPICYGNVGATGGINSGSGNFTVNQTLAGTYEITITGETFVIGQYTPVITAINGGAPVIGTVTSGGGILRVIMFNTAGTRVDNSFTFVVYKQ